ncbi:TATE DNA Transposon [Trypanosoma theileri]|uniref:TATE DNA Transposon n=1 Tax=Trypanosoma theileri TaxID=67003 RepID=A0A1X0P2M1_9TRYP|nr:TATE DNA Transposon [Trypanosoma theileri]ORC91162.1 TATE DNA Transposon [Trypanosoma theileri]
MTEQQVLSIHEITEVEVLSIRELAQEGFTGDQLERFLRTLQRAGDRNDTKMLDQLRTKALEASLARGGESTTSDDKAKLTESTKYQGDVDYLRQQKEHDYFPWKRDLALAEIFWGKCSADDDDNEKREAAKKIFISKAKGGRLTTTEVMIGQYMFFAEDPAYGWKCLQRLLFLCDTKQRVQFHNWGLFATLDPYKQNMYGARVEKLQYPLFPDHPEFRKLNAKLLRPTKGTIHGGSSDETLELEKMYDMNREGLITGGGYSDAIYDAHGQQIAPRDMSNIQQQLANLRAKVEDLHRKLSHHTNTPNHFPNTKQRATGTRQRKGNTGTGGSKGRGCTLCNKPTISVQGRWRICES